MLKWLACTVIQSRGIKHTVNIKWVRPENVPFYKPEKSGDLEGVPAIPETALGEIYALSEEIKDAPKSVLKIFSVAHLGGKEFNNLVRQELVNRVKRHQYDCSTAEAKIAWLTGQIRYLQANMEKFPRNKKVKILVLERIDRRKKLLKYLRQYDYKKFEWLLEKLNIEYKAHPESHNKLSRKQSLKKLTKLHCEEIRQNKLDDYKNLLESQQGPFLKEKLENLRFIRNEQIELEVPITVSEQDIKKVERMLEKWTIQDEIKQVKKKKRGVVIDLN